MASRRLIRDSSESRTDGKVTYRLDPTGPIDEGSIEQELLPIVYRHHPALDDVTGRLKQRPGVRDLMVMGPELFLAQADQGGVSLLGGVRLPPSLRAAFLNDLKANGWVIEE